MTAIPLNTPATEKVYIAGTFNNWNPGDPTKILTAQPNGQYSITLNPAVGPVRFKFTRGNWDSVEGDITGGFQADHIVTYTGMPQTIDVIILSWEDLGAPDPGTHVTVLDNNFFMPQLNRTRRVWIYVPPDYQTSTKKYPVMYMQDGQNLFDPSTSFAGEWEVDESLDKLFAQGDYGCIVVGIDNGGAYRLDEYSPWVNSLYGGGQGDEYMSFIVKTLKPYIDAHYRTMPGRNHTGIMGSSMGGLVSMYGIMEYQTIFSKAGIFSPAFWFAGDHPADQVLGAGKRDNLKVYFLAGGQEPAYVQQDVQEVVDAMLQTGFNASEIQVKTPTDGQHAEWFWKREFPAAYQWLFAGTVTATGEAASDAPSLDVYPNPAMDWIQVSGMDDFEQARVQIVSADGSVQQDVEIQAGESIFTGDLPAGFYAVRVKTQDEGWQTLKMIRQ
ncbi:MAG: T9SS type A sorting domain-containing protein [Saprospiraceae bacterium]|nr:T9SS type A sorting domain-containing protein [Saprospiraceae bacterium]